jgi:hypothetical protein
MSLHPSLITPSNMNGTPTAAAWQYPHTQARTRPCIVSTKYAIPDLNERCLAPPTRPNWTILNACYATRTQALAAANLSSEQDSYTYEVEGMRLYHRVSSRRIFRPWLRCRRPTVLHKPALGCVSTVEALRPSLRPDPSHAGWLRLKMVP